MNNRTSKIIILQGEIDLRIKCLLCIYEGLHSNLQVPHNPDVVSHVSNSIAFTMRQELETGEALEATAQ